MRDLHTVEFCKMFGCECERTMKLIDEMGKICVGTHFHEALLAFAFLSEFALDELVLHMIKGLIADKNSPVTAEDVTFQEYKKMHIMFLKDIKTYQKKLNRANLYNQMIRQGKGHSYIDRLGHSEEEFCSMLKKIDERTLKENETDESQMAT